MATVDLRAKGHAEWEAEQADRITAARDALGAVIGAANAAEGAVDVVELLGLSSGYTVIFVDAAGVNVAVTIRETGNEVRLAQQGDDGAWSYLGDPVTSLAHLWTLIDEYLPATYPEWVQPTGSTDAYALGDRVTHNGKVWESLVNANVWEPGVSQWREVVA